MIKRCPHVGFSTNFVISVLGAMNVYDVIPADRIAEEAISPEDEFRQSGELKVNPLFSPSSESNTPRLQRAASTRYLPIATVSDDRKVQTLARTVYDVPPGQRTDMYDIPRHATEVPR